MKASRALVGRVARRSFHQTKCSEAPSSTTGQANLLQKGWEAYARRLNSHPLTTKMSAAAIIFFSSDSLTQFLTPQVRTWDVSRAASGAAFGIVSTAWLHYWWGFLETAVGSRLPIVQYRLSNAMAKVFLDQAIGAPLYIYTYYVLTNTLQIMAAKPQQAIPDVLQETTDKANDMLWPTMLRHWRVWPIVHSINFYFVPLHHRVLVQNTVLIGWSAYLSHLNNGGMKIEKEKVGELMTPENEIKETLASQAMESKK